MAWYNLVGKNRMSVRDVMDDGKIIVPAFFKGEEIILVPYNRGHEFSPVEPDRIGKEMWGYPSRVFFPDEEEATEYGWPKGSTVVHNHKGPFFEGGFGGVVWTTSHDYLSEAQSCLLEWLKERETLQLGYCHRDGETGAFPPPPEGYMYHEVHGHWEGEFFGLAYPKPTHRCKVPNYRSWFRHWDEWLQGCEGYVQMEVVPGTLVFIRRFNAEWIRVEDLKGWQDQNPFKVIAPKLED